MDEPESNPIKLIPDDTTPKDMETSISSFHKPLADLLTHIGLPTENILSPIDERRKVIYSLESTLECLPLDDRKKSHYLSKFTVAATIGLFDGALTFLWDETIEALMRNIANFDLQYFYEIASNFNSNYQNLQTKDDLYDISAHDLLEISRRMGLINNIEFKKLEHVNYLRNHASSAHPNDNEISGIELLSLLEYCLKYAITADPDHSAIEIKKLLENIRKNRIPDEDFNIIGQDIAEQPQERIDDFIKSIFGMYCDQNLSETVKINIEKLMPHVWDSAQEETKYFIGANYGKYRKNGEVKKKEATQKILEIVDGEQYKDNDSLTAELMEKLQILKSVHFGHNNFYNEYLHAESIEKSIPPSGIPSAVRGLFVKVICLGYIGNGKGFREGVDERALTYYKKFIERFTKKEIIEFIKLFKDQEFTTDFRQSKVVERVKKLVDNYFKDKIKNVHINRILDLILSLPPEKIRNLVDTEKYKRSMEYI